MYILYKLSPGFEPMTFLIQVNTKREYLPPRPRCLGERSIVSCIKKVYQMDRLVFMAYCIYSTNIVSSEPGQGCHKKLIRSINWLTSLSSGQIKTLWLSSNSLTAQIIEMALSIYALRLCPTFEKLFTGVNVWCRAQKIGTGHKTTYEIDPRIFDNPAIKCTVVVQWGYSSFIILPRCQGSEVRISVTLFLDSIWKLRSTLTYDGSRGQLFLTFGDSG